MTITAPDAPTLPSLNDPANFNTRALALFSWLVTEYIPWLETLAGVTEDGEINGIPIGQKAAAAGKFTTLLADSIGGTAVQSSESDVSTASKLVPVGHAGAASLSAFGTYYGSSAGYNIDNAQAGDRGLVSTVNPGTWPSDVSSFAWFSTQKMYTGDAVIQTLIDGYTSSGTPNLSGMYWRVRSNNAADGWSPWRQVVAEDQIQAHRYDSTINKLMMTGAFGLGGWGEVVSDFSTLPYYSQFVAGGGGSTVEPPPDGGAYKPGIAAYRSSSNRTSILMFTVSGLAMRNYTAGVPDEDWVRLYSEKNILGTVSQSGGVPTGAVIERGSNANGDYVRLADGTQICWATIAMDYVSTSLLTTDWTYAAAFSGYPNVSVTPMDYRDSAAPAGSTWNGSEPVTPFVRTSGVTTAKFYARQASNWATGDKMAVHVQAIGRWY